MISQNSVFLSEAFLSLCHILDVVWRAKPVRNYKWHPGVTVNHISILSVPIILGANSSEFMPVSFILNTTIRSFPTCFVLTGLAPRPKFTSVYEPNRSDFTSTSV